MSDPQPSTPNRVRGRWGRTKRTQSYDSDEKNYNFRSNSDDGIGGTSGANSDQEVSVGGRKPRRKIFFHHKEPGTPTDKKGIFSRHRKKRAEKKEEKKRKKKVLNGNTRQVKSDGESVENDASEDNISSDDQKEEYETITRRKQFQQLRDDDQMMDSSGEGGRGDSSYKRPNLRKNVSFDASTEDVLRNKVKQFNSPPTPAATSEDYGYSDQIDTNDYNYNVDSGGEEANDQVTDFGYNTFDFPMPSTSNNSRISSHYSSGSPRVPARERARYSVYHGSVKKKFRVRPYHCFQDQAVHMTEEEIYADSLLPSRDFVPLKSYLKPTSKSTRKIPVPENVKERWGSPSEDGRIGAIRIEVLGCVSLNRTKPDVSVYLVCGDTAFCTDVLNGYRSPMWPCVSRRAAIFPLHHAYAKMYVGVFDARIRKNKENDVFCGRVVLDIASIRPDTEYDTTMPLRASSFVYDKRKRGVIRLRFSLHWFSERAAVMSYFKSVNSLVESSPLVEGHPGIPCADPKTFRNVAVTVYGQDLPGKYSRNAFRATMREFNLYQQNLRLLVKVLVLDAMLYEQPWMSLYLFCAAMYSVVMNSVKMVPAFFVGYILILYVENYQHFLENNDFHLGYKPLTVAEVFKALVMNSGQASLKDPIFEPIKIEKRTKKRRGQAAARLRRLGSQEDIIAEEEEDEEEIKPMDHREFPFADRDAYPKFSVEDALAPGSSKGGTGRLHGRLSVYYTAEPASLGETGSADGEDDSDLDSDRDDETVMTESQMMGDNMFDIDSEAEDEDEAGIDCTDINYKRAMTMQSNTANAKRRIRLGPPQDSDVSGKKIPPQVTLRRVENMINKASRSISVELIHEPPRVEKVDVGFTESAGINPNGMPMISAELQAKMLKKGRKLPYDDFDKLLGLQSRSANPVHRILSSFMGPLMRMIRVGVYLVRVSFNITTWRDPFLSFWILVLLCLLCLILIIFPWRAFFFLSSVVCLGPQNVFLRKYLEKKAEEKAKKEAEDDDDTEKSEKLEYKIEPASLGKQPRESMDESTSARMSDRSDNRRTGGLFAKLRKDATGRAQRRRSATMNSSSQRIDEEDDMERPPFESALHGQSSGSRRLQPRSVAIPYSCLKKERFYDWPPDPTVSKANPIPLYTLSMDDVDSLTVSVPEVTMPDHDHDEQPSTLRRRHNATESVPSAGIPTDISFPS